MTRLLPLLAVAVLGASARPFVPLAPAAYSRDPILSCYEAAAARTGAPEPTLRGLAFAESSYRLDPPHPDPHDRGRFGLHESPEFHAERAARYGEYDPLDPYDAAYIAGRLYADALERLGDEDAAIAAHKQGVAGVRRDGALGWYLARVKGATR